MKLLHFGYSLLDIWSIVVTEQEEKNYVYAVNHSAHCPTNLNEKLFDKFIFLKFHRQRSEQIFSAKRYSDTYTILHSRI